MTSRTDNLQRRAAAGKRRRAGYREFLDGTQAWPYTARERGRLALVTARGRGVDPRLEVDAILAQIENACRVLEGLTGLDLVHAHGPLSGIAVAAEQLAALADKKRNDWRVHLRMGMRPPGGAV